MPRSLLLAALLLVPAALPAQQDWTVTGRVTSSATSAPIALAEVRTLDGKRSAFTDAAGRYTLRNVPSGPLTLRVRQVGFKFRDIPVTLPADAAVKVRTVDVALEPVAFVLPELVTKSACEQGGFLLTQDERLRSIFEQVREASVRFTSLVKAYPAVVTAQRPTWRYTSRLRQLISDQSIPDSLEGAAYRRGGILKRTGNGGWSAPIPDLGSLASDEFDRNHCFSYDGTEDAPAGKLIRVRFEPLVGIGSPDWEGVIFIDATTAMPRRMEWRLTKLDPKREPTRLEVVTIFSELYPSLIISDSSEARFWYAPENREAMGNDPDRIQAVIARGLTFLKDEPDVAPLPRGRQLLGPLWRPKKKPPAAAPVADTSAAATVQP
ncbi:MAG: carboxypeptidase-like regulatory domain-containing protein [Gemmatimonadales bacterium]|nr:carboxypeptidase-like regulatory domain-containing protein [Gemmatimonadales bacterium]